MSAAQPTDDERRIADVALRHFPAEVAILDSDGDIVSTNLAWRMFGEANGYHGDVGMVGVNYLDVCDAAAADDDDDAATAATGIRSVLAGTHDSFDFEYPCHSPATRRWFVMRAVPLESDGDDRYVLVAHLNVTDRKLAELDVREQTNQLEGIATLLSEDVQRELSTALGRSVLLNREDGTKQSLELEASLHRVNALVTDALALLTGADVELVTVDLEASAKAAWRKVDTLDATLSVDASGVLAADVGLVGRLFQHLFECALVLGGTDVHVSVGTSDDGVYVAFDREQAVSTTVDGRTAADNVESSVAVATRIAEVHGWTLTTDADGTIRYEVSGIEWQT
jgi:PAS domain-containing protein